MPYKSGVSVTAGPCPSHGVAVPQGWLDSLGAQIKAFGKACGALPGQSGAAGTQPSVPQVVEVSLIPWAGVLGQEILGPPGSPEGLCSLVPALQDVLGSPGPWGHAEVSLHCRSSSMGWGSVVQPGRAGGS